MENTKVEMIVRVLKQRRNSNRKFLDSVATSDDPQMAAILGSAWRESDEILSLIEALVS